MGKDQHVETIRQLCRHIETHADEPLSLATLGRRAGLSAPHLQRVFKRITGVSPRQYARACRMDRLKARLRGRETVTRATYQAGFGSSSRVYEHADDRLGMTPGTYREGGSHMTIGYTVSDCPLGRLLMAATPRGICAVILGDDDAELREWLTEEFPRASIAADDGRLSGWLGEILAHLGGQRPHLDLPLDVQATAFQMRVWQKLREIPFGQTRTYAQVAADLGQPTATRAVARACATNPASIVIPCHRVVRQGGALGGYRWGLDRKRRLLEGETKGK
jgi:AraC family transcriptional regulator, regulatory protein of adaptative response / methylated-DNA-[protein]-cysteine methyltransferase